MKITGIKRQLKRTDRLAIFVDGQYALSLSEAALLESKLVTGQELSEAQLQQMRELAAADNLYDQAQHYVALRLRSQWEMTAYLQRKGASSSLLQEILNKLSNNGWLDDEKFAAAFVADRQRLRPTSRRKIILALSAKHISNEVVQKVLPPDETEERTALRELIRRKRRQTRYQDDRKLMQYLSRQGFSYGDIKMALEPQD
jgi:regulatory protein